MYLSCSDVMTTFILSFLYISEKFASLPAPPPNLLMIAVVSKPSWHLKYGV